MRVLVACEFSGTVRDAFARRGHDAWSCDLLPTESPGQHIQGDVLEVLGDGWDLMIAHPPCTYLTRAGERWMHDKVRYPNRAADREAGIRFVIALWAAPITRIAIENPRGVLTQRWRRPSQIIQPWEHGHPETKATCLWLKGLPPLMATSIKQLSEDKRERCKIWSKYGKGRWKERSLTYAGIAAAMAAQWGALPTPATPTPAASR